MKIFLHISALALLAGLPALPAAAQMDGQLGEEPLIVDPMSSARDAMARGDPAEALARYLRVLARDPGDLDALSGAGSAALAVGDADAAINFYVRAEKISPRDGRVKAGLGSALVQKEQPRAALRLFDTATDLGVAPYEVALDRGLAYDLRGDNRKAQAEYALLLRVRPNEAEASRRLALSLAMSGDRAGALAILDPLLRKRDIPAWRARAFVLAMTGDSAGAQAAAYAVLPRYQADALKPFLERLPSLKSAEKAAAVHFGHFPEDKVPLEMAASSPVASVKASPAPNTPPPPPKSAKPAFDSTGRLVMKVDTLAAKAGSAPMAGIAGDASGDGAPTAAEQRASDARSLAEDRRAAQKKAAAEKAAAEKKAKAKEEAQEAAKAKKANPSRYWVQIASGSYKPDLDKEWDKQKSRHGKLLSGKSPWTTPFKATNRLLIGPFASSDAAQDYVNEARAAGLSCFPVTTSAGQKVERLN
ncbi:SPOR domain-containing protein [Sphingomonas sp. Root710]|uniref:SPOR domain-containing protein n=1 Tax=Sphingomonas sp. Root710 TaxID=1736594 RepID=UPI001F477378|nr:SPOR domain-containing protein [Sphingomonas sp. Root710]